MESKWKDVIYLFLERLAIKLNNNNLLLFITKLSYLHNFRISNLIVATNDHNSNASHQGKFLTSSRSLMILKSRAFRGIIAKRRHDISPGIPFSQRPRFFLLDSDSRLAFAVSAAARDRSLVSRCL